MHSPQRPVSKRPRAMEPVCTYMYHVKPSMKKLQTHEMSVSTSGTTLRIAQNTRHPCDSSKHKTYIPVRGASDSTLNYLILSYSTLSYSVSAAPYSQLVSTLSHSVLSATIYFQLLTLSHSSLSRSTLSYSPFSATLYSLLLHFLVLSEQSPYTGVFQLSNE